MDKTTGLSDTNGVQKDKYNAWYMSYAESTIATIKSSIASLQKSVEETKKS